ncbi:DUF998 domain-containing protein [Blastococcus sp. TF02A-26]|uniref:DUF998 domain-containing protein n=1 Tax=Blastococcus sp. TF02A-26 TaxID=2250577 RepID=UPI000DE87507|nr:DUF998 domain-containing protein [Blastococcus sp. TF02A-26]RBY88261.1 DUF998 domain-containing protein [Blastococcus sp. TF02A-26]
MAAVTRTRLRLGALLWLLTLQFFVVETVVQAQYELAYSRVDDVISLLGSSASSGQTLMNASFVAQGVLIVAGLVLLRPALPGRGGQVATAMLTAAAVGVVVVGLFPLGDDDTAHRFGAFLYLLGSGIGLIGTAYAVRPRSEALGTVLALLGLFTTAMTVFYLAGVTGYLGEGGTERAAAYPLPLGLVIAGIGLLVVVDRPVSEAATGRRALREQARAERIRRARERDEALEAAAARAAATGRPDADPDAPPAQDDASATDDFDPDDPWATPRRRRDT